MGNIPFLAGMNWMDIAIILVILFYSIEGYALGFFGSLFDLVSFISAFFFGLATYGLIGKIIISLFPVSPGFANAIGFFIAAFSAEIIINILIKKFAAPALLKNLTIESDLEKRAVSILGILPSIFSALILLSFVLTMILTLPLAVPLKTAVTNSKFGSSLVLSTQGFGKDINKVFGGAVNEGLAFFTIQPKSDESVNLNFKTKDVTVDKKSEREMFNLVNKEREKDHKPKLIFNESLSEVGRKHCKDMFARGYFSHYNPDGLSPFDRMAQSDISFNYAGENLALAPNVQLAMQGFMDSPGHKANILSENFGEVGIAAIDGGIYGQMYCQEFKD